VPPLVNRRGRAGVAVPGNLLRRRELLLQNTKARAGCMLNTTLSLIEMARVGVRFLRVGLP
jgi:hypothetical protein